MLVELTKHAMVLIIVMSAILPTIAQETITVDYSQAVPFKVVWQMDMGGEMCNVDYSRDFCGDLDLDVVTSAVTRMGHVTHQTWRTTPLLDTANLFNWLGINNACTIQELDYDGIPPVEYVTYTGIVWRCSQGSSPFPLMPIDTVSNEAPHYSTDVDGDGYVDVVCGTGNSAFDGKQIVWGGPNAGKGYRRLSGIGAMHKRRYASVATF